MADRISELERQHFNQAHLHQKYTFLDPTKTTRVPNPALKAFQKNAVQSYFERQQTTAKEAARNVANLNATSLGLSSAGIPSSPAGTLTRPQSLQLTSTIAKQSPHSRSSLPNNYSQLNSLSCSLKSPTTAAASTVHATPVMSTSSNTSLNASPAQSRTPSAPNTPPTGSPSSHSPKILTSPSYQATFHQPIAPFNVSMPSVVHLSPGHENYSGIVTSKLIMVSEGCLQSANESGVPPPPPRRTRSMMPVRRFDYFSIILLLVLIKSYFTEHHLLPNTLRTVIAICRRIIPQRTS